ncbi:MAG: hypothetical protein EPO35_09240 [Acidobacteria bacterium]|nr:MAG: hypothetical protein EPO35_09240 [Acidobacteriota bacterium]
MTIGKCADAQKVPWDQYIAAFQNELKEVDAIKAQRQREGLPPLGSSTNPELRAFEQKILDVLAAAEDAVQRLKAEQDHVRQELARRATIRRQDPPLVFTGPRVVTPGPASRDAPLAWVRPFVPGALKRFLNAYRQREIGTLIATGHVRIRDGDKIIELETGAKYVLKDFQEVITETDGFAHIVFNDGRERDLLPNTVFDTRPCDLEVLNTGTSGFARRMRQPSLLVRGTLRHLISGRSLNVCEQVQTGGGAGAPQGTVFDLSYDEADEQGVTVLTVKNGQVEFLDFSGNTTLVASGETRLFRASIRPPLAADDPIRVALESGRAVDRQGRTFVPGVIGGVWLDDSWRAVAPLDDARPGLLDFQSTDGQLGGRILTSTVPLSRAELRQAAVDEIVASAPTAVVTREEWREINGMQVLDLVFDLTPGGTANQAIGRYFTGGQGHAELYLFGRRAAMQARQSAVDAVFSGLVIVSPLMMRPPK